MNPISDTLMNSLSGALAAGGSLPDTGRRDEVDAGERGSDGSRSPSRFAAVLDRVQTPNTSSNLMGRGSPAASRAAAGLAQAAAADRRQADEASDRAADIAARDTAEAAEATEPADAADDRQEVAAGLSAQWAALVRGDTAGRRAADGADDEPTAAYAEPDKGAGEVSLAPAALPLAAGPQAADGSGGRGLIRDEVTPDVLLALDSDAEPGAGLSVARPGVSALLAEEGGGRSSAGKRPTLEEGLYGVSPRAHGRALAVTVDDVSAGAAGIPRVAQSGSTGLTLADTLQAGGGKPGERPFDSGTTHEAGQPLLPLPTLVAWQLSPQLAVITAGQPAASDESLRAFAQAQGFDAQALHRMFGSEAEPIGGSESGAPVPEGGGADLAAASSLALGAPGWWAQAMSPSGIYVGGAVQPTALTAAASAIGSVEAASMDPTSVAWAEQAPPAAELAASDPSARVLKRPVDFGLDVNNGIQKTAISDIMSIKEPKVNGLTADALNASRAGEGRFRVTRGPVEAAGQLGDAGRSGGVLGGTNGTPVVATSAWLALQARAGATGSTGALAGTASLGSGIDDQALTAGPGYSAMALSTSTPSAPVAMAVSDGVGPVLKPDQATRPVDTQPLDLRAHLEQGNEALSKRLGEALAARLLAQIDKGEWQIRLTVAPQHLGPIDIDLQMRGQRIDAQFQVAHGQTQALIQDNLPRLREAVGASGMDLASVWVSGGWSDRDRGNPTPGQPDNPAALALNDEAGDEQTAQASAPVESDRSGRGTRPGAVDILI